MNKFVWTAEDRADMQIETEIKNHKKRDFLSWLSGWQIQLVSMRMQIQSLALLGGLRIQHYHEPWYRLAATAPIQPLAWEPPYAMGAVLKRQKTKQKQTKKKPDKHKKREKESMKPSGPLMFSHFASVLLSPDCDSFF